MDLQTEFGKLRLLHKLGFASTNLLDYFLQYFSSDYYNGLYNTILLCHNRWLAQQYRPNPRNNNIQLSYQYELAYILILYPVIKLLIIAASALSASMVSNSCESRSLRSSTSLFKFLMQLHVSCNTFDAETCTHVHIQNY